MRKLNMMLPALIFAAVVGLAQIGVGSAFAAPSPATAPQFGHKQPQTGQMGQPGLKKTAKKFHGTIEMKKGQYVLDAGGATYHLTDQAAAKQFNGKNVTVTGTLNAANDTIEVLSIQAG